MKGGVLRSGFEVLGVLGSEVLGSGFRVKEEKLDYPVNLEL